MRSLSALILIAGGAQGFSSGRPHRSSLRLLGGHRDLGIKSELGAFDFIFGGNDESGKKTPDDDDDQTFTDEDPMSASFQDELLKRGKRSGSNEDERTEDRSNENDDEFDGYQLRDAIYDKYGECFDLEFQRVDSYGFRQVYLNVMPFRLGGRRFRRKSLRFLRVSLHTACSNSNPSCKQPCRRDRIRLPLPFAGSGRDTSEV